jgi:hypothetical protein
MVGRRLACEPLRCPACGAGGRAHERFCASCGMPLVHGDGEPPAPPSERQVRARKIKPQLTEGRLVRAASARNQPEAELIAGLLLEAGIPSLVRRSAGFDVPDFLAAGPRDVLVPESALADAREALLAAEITVGALGGDPGGAGGVRPLGLALGLAAALLVGVLLIWALTVLR